jgi:hypothetical protein
MRPADVVPERDSPKTLVDPQIAAVLTQPDAPGLDDSLPIIMGCV